MDSASEAEKSGEKSECIFRQMSEGEGGGGGGRLSKKDSTRRSNPRRSNKRYFTSSFTTILDSLGETISRMKRSGSCERGNISDDTEVVKPNPDKSSKAPIHRDSGYAESLTNFPSGRRYSEQLSNPSHHHEDEGEDGQPVENKSFPESLAPLAIKESEETYRQKAMDKLNEFLTTEETYVHKDLSEVVNGYMKHIELCRTDPENYIKLPPDLSAGKLRIVFGNIKDIYELHLNSIHPAIKKAVTDPKYLRILFESKRDTLKLKYGRFCLNKPKSEYIISEYERFFAKLKLKEGFRHNMSSVMMTPVQRVTRFHLLLGDMAKNLRKTSDEQMLDDVNKALEIAKEIADYANIMMLAGRINGLNEDEDVTAHGLLLTSGQANCYEKRPGVKKPKMKKCHLFVFQETIIICEIPHVENESKHHQNLDYITSFKMNKLNVREITKNDSVYGFELEKTQTEFDMESSHKVSTWSSRKSSTKERKGSTKEGHLTSKDDTIVIICQTEDQRNEWLKAITDEIRTLKNMAISLVNPTL